MSNATLTYKINIRADQQTIFNYVSDWEKQSEWILFTTVKNVSDPAHDRRITLLATTKLGPCKLIDDMSVTELVPGEKIVVEHNGRVILGKGVFTINKTTPGKCQFVWQEITPVPFGIIGQIGLIAAKPFLKLMFGASLRRLKHNCEQINS